MSDFYVYLKFPLFYCFCWTSQVQLPFLQSHDFLSAHLQFPSLQLHAPVPHEPSLHPHPQHAPHHILLQGHPDPQIFQHPHPQKRAINAHSDIRIKLGFSPMWFQPKIMIRRASIAPALTKIPHPDKSNNQARISPIVAIHPRATLERNHKKGNSPGAADQIISIHSDPHQSLVTPKYRSASQVRMRMIQSTLPHRPAEQLEQFFILMYKR